MSLSPKFENRVAEERLRQVRQSFNLAIGCITACVATTFFGIGLVYTGKFGIGVVTGVAGAAPITHCVRFYREASDRLDELMDESDDDDKNKEPDDDDEENAPA
jgi:hypothetical protein